MVDEKLLRVIEGAIQGDEQSFKKLLDARAKNVLYIAIEMMGNQHDGKDAAQEALLTVKRSIHQLQSPEAFDVWMYRIVFGACMDMKRKMKRSANEVPIESQALSVPEMRQEFLPHEYVEREDERARLMAAVSELPEKYRACLLLYYFEDFSYAEIASSLDISMTAVSTRLNRAKKKLRKLLEAEFGTSIGASGFGVAALPVMTEAFRIDADAVASADVVDKLKEAVLAGAGVAAAATVSTASALSLGVVAKTVIAGLAAAALLGGAWFLTTLPSSAQSDATPMSPSSIQAPAASPGRIANDEEEKEDGRLPEASEPTAPSEPSSGETIEVSSETTAPGEPMAIPPEAKPLRDTIGVTATYQYLVYQLDSETSRTLYIERTSQSGERAVVRKTGPLDMKPPSGIDIISAFDSWQGGA
ncbi:hypothetical protein C1878_02875 [Gordonibacter sp. 28C]|uniref:RNA polymerase sigma factor n=1 Tax=Gordonibacter sp. 28C TaxID=2078569 RepID=UPI000DF79476|nr:RNA polymerase sigma factor [Gordonibacter sp. 28C]RDB63758.1 hypothetical protein C1878_02875 [Gordonibacter sp. 28C]